MKYIFILKMVYNEFELCKRCNAKDSIITDYEAGELVCNYCGLVYEERMIVDEDEKRTFENDEGDNQIHRVGPPMNPVYGNECGTNLIIHEYGKTRYIKDYPNSSKIQKKFQKIQNLLSSVNVSKNMIEETKTLYDKFAKGKKMQGKNINKIIIGIYYYVCRKEKCAKTIKEIVLMFNNIFPGLTERNVKKAFNTIKRDIVEPTQDDNEISEREKNFIQTYTWGDKDKYDLKMLSYEIIDNINKNNLLLGKSPKTVAGLSLFLSNKLLNDNLNDKNEFYKMFCLKNTLKKSFDEIKPFLSMVVPQKYASQINLLLQNDLFKSF